MATSNIERGPFKGQVGGECWIESCQTPAVKNFYVNDFRPYGEQPQHHYCQAHGLELRAMPRSAVHQVDDEGRAVL